MIGQETREVERKILAILKVLSDSGEPLGGRVISHRLSEQGIDLCERAVRYHLKLMDERGLTRRVCSRDGREITPSGLDELGTARVWDKIGFLTDRIELLSYLTTFDVSTITGDVPIDVSLFAREDFSATLRTMRCILKAGFCISNLITHASEGEKLGEVVVPKGKIGLATISNVLISGLLLKSGVPIESRFIGLVQMHNFKPVRFVEFIECHSSSVDPLELFISSRMTSVNNAVKTGEGRILASFLEIPTRARSMTEAILENLKTINLCDFFITGNSMEPLYEIPVSANKIGLVLYSGLNPMAAVAEEGINVTNKAMSGVIDIRKLNSCQNL
jgi:repressor of nif and glnA expression